MITEEHETIYDIVAEMRQDIADGTVGMWADFGGEIARGYVNRIEAAAMREREAGAESAQIREMFDFKINEIESMKDATLDGCFEHQEQNVIKLCAKLDFYEFAKYTLSQLSREGGSVHY